MSEYRDSSSNNLLSLISGAFIGAAGLAWWLISEADKRKEEKKQKAMMYSSRIQDGSEAIDSNRILLITAICSNKGLNEIAKIFPNQVIYTSCIDEEDENTKLLVPGIGNPLLRLSTIFQD